MKNEKPSGFRFRLDDEGPDPGYRDEVQDRKPQKSGRGTPLAVILILLFGAAAGWGYYDLKKGVMALRNMDVSQVQSLSQDLNSRFSSLSVQTAKLEESIKNLQGSLKALEAQFEKKILPLDEFFMVFEKRTSALKEDIDKTAKSIEVLKGFAADKSTVAQAMTNLENKILPLSEHLKNVESEIKGLDENLTQELAEVSGNFYKLQNSVNQFEKIQKDLSALSTEKLDKKGFEAELKNLEKRLSGEFDKIKAESGPRGESLDDIQRQLKTMESQIDELMKFKAISEIKKRLQSENPSANPSGAPLPGTQNPPPEKPQAVTPEKSPPSAPKRSEVPVIPKPGKIIEESL
jgi:DNA repair exonuclease SbcCD ATPase subunit